MVNFTFCVFYHTSTQNLRGLEPVCYFRWEGLHLALRSLYSSKPYQLMGRKWGVSCGSTRGPKYSWSFSSSWVSELRIFSLSYPALPPSLSSSLPPSFLLHIFSTCLLSALHPVRCCSVRCTRKHSCLRPFRCFCRCTHTALLDVGSSSVYFLC